ncbi:hypothetical protein ACQP00_18170 [Dactylosporangium sp. CS-047395]|uniref:hypothetical protein n=1 Tax=Dactylosporangium sp. CS-047395 TaxID=3239936 RepID=UPI003D9369F0
MIQLPESWFEGRLPELPTVADCATALREDAPRLRAITSREPARDLEAGLFAALDGEAGHAVVGYPAEVPATVAATLLAAWLGMPAEGVHDDVGGTVSHVVSGVGHRHDQAWHTDSTPWLLPNRYSVLGLLSAPGPQPEATGVLPIRRLHTALLDDPEALAALRGEALPWRVNFPHLPQLWGAILDPAVPRWVRPAVDPLRDRMSPALARGVLRLEAALAGAVPWYEPATAPGRLVMFDNHRVMHRGPLLEQDSGRELIRIKIGGRAVR